MVGLNTASYRTWTVTERTSCSGGRSSQGSDEIHVLSGADVNSGGMLDANDAVVTLEYGSGSLKSMASIGDWDSNVPEWAVHTGTNRIHAILAQGLSDPTQAVFRFWRPCRQVLKKAMSILALRCSPQTSMATALRTGLLETKALKATSMVTAPQTSGWCGVSLLEQRLVEGSGRKKTLLNVRPEKQVDHRPEAQERPERKLRTKSSSLSDHECNSDHRTGDGGNKDDGH